MTVTNTTKIEKEKILSVIIVSYNQLEVLKDCLDSIEKHNDIGDLLEVIVVEQSPAEEIYKKIKECYPWVVLIRTTNEGFGSGNNKGVAVASGRYYLFLNSDTILVEPVFAFAVSKFKSNRRLGMFGLKLVTKDNKENASLGIRCPYGLTRSLLLKICTRLGIFIRKMFYISGADMFVKADVFISAGKFDEQIFMYWEETDLCHRIEKQGYIIKYFPDKRIVHLGGASSGSINQRNSIIKSYKYICDKQGLDYRDELGKWELDQRKRYFLTGRKSNLDAAEDLRRMRIKMK